MKNSALNQEEKGIEPESSTAQTSASAATTVPCPVHNPSLIEKLPFQCENSQNEMQNENKCWNFDCCQKMELSSSGQL